MVSLNSLLKTNEKECVAQKKLSEEWDILYPINGVFQKSFGKKRGSDFRLKVVMKIRNYINEVKRSLRTKKERNLTFSLGREREKEKAK